MPKIIQLDSHLANLIAAGEVVERPASVVKELVENAIDAGARNITVELQNGGVSFLRVSDDGCGMEREDAKTAFLRHATSKLRSPEDLAAIGTLGFRGEALAATAAVSRVELLTRSAEALAGTSLRLEAGKLLSCEDAGCPVGTTIVVRDLFFNTPARMKFLKRDSVEGGAAAGAVQRLAMAHPEISFRLLKDGELQLQTPGDGELLSAVYAVLGRQAASEMIPVESAWERLGVSGFVSRPTATRGTRTNQFFYVNQRHIRSRTLSAALEEAYRNRLMAGRFPFCVLNVTMPLSAVDVNVHPAKTEVKFLNEKEVFDCVYYGVFGALNRDPGQTAFVFGAGADDRQPPSQAAAPPTPPRQETTAPDERFFRSMSAEEYRKAAKPQVHTVTRWEYEQMTKALGGKTMPAPSRALQDAVAATTLHSPVSLPEFDDARSFPPEAAGGLPAAGSAGAPECPTPPRPAPEAPAPQAGEQAAIALPDVALKPAFRYIGELFQTYILVERGDELVLIDKHAAHERMNFNRLLAQGSSVIGQTLLSPVTARFEREEAAILLERRELLLSLGYDIDDLGQGDLLLRQIPSDIRQADAAATLSEIAEHLRSGRLDSPQSLREALLRTIACKAAIKAGYVTDPIELQKLAETVLTREDLKYCPHGRPICTVISKKQLEKQFKRIT